VVVVKARLELARGGLRIAVAICVLLGAGALAPGAASAESTSSLEEIYAALRPQNLRTPTARTAFDAGDALEFQYDLVNTSATPLVIPLTDFFGASFHLVGSEQSWLERLGPDPTIPSIPAVIGRKGTWYASGGAISAVEGLPGNTLPAGGVVPRGASVFYSTDEFPTGRYRFHVEYKPVFGGLYDVIAETRFDFTIGGVPPDGTPPVIDVPSDILAEATSSAGALVSYAVSAMDAVDGSLVPDCSPVTGAMFALGTTTVSCTASDSAGNEALASFDITVADTLAPSLTLPASFAADATSALGADVTYSASATDIVDGATAALCTPASGSTFVIGDTTVSCTATDAARNSARGSFTVHIKGAPEQIADLIVLVDGYPLGKLGSSLHDKLVSTQRFLASGKRQQAKESLASFISQVAGQRGKGLTPAQADALNAAAQRILNVIGP